MSHNLPEGWRLVQLRLICNFTKGQFETMKTNPGSYPFVVTAASRSTADVYQLDEPAVCIPLISSTGHGDAAIHRVHYQDGKFAVANLLVALTAKDKDECDVEYLYHLFMAKKDEYFVPLMTGTANVSLRIEDIELTKALLPPLDEQRRIAAVLRDTDASIASVEDAIAAAQEVKRGVMRRLFTYGLGDESTPTKQTEVGEIPEHWKISIIEWACEIHNHLRLPLSADVRKQMPGIYPYYGPTGILGYINVYRVEGQYALIGEDGDHFLKFDERSMTQLVAGRFNVNNHAHLLRGKDSCLTEWVYHFFRHRDITTYLLRQGAGRYKLNKATLESLPLAVPSVEEQREIAAILQAHDNAIQAMLVESDRLREVKRGLMQALLSGAIRV